MSEIGIWAYEFCSKFSQLIGLYYFRSHKPYRSSSGSIFQLIFFLVEHKNRYMEQLPTKTVKVGILLRFVRVKKV